MFSGRLTTEIRKFTFVYKFPRSQANPKRRTNVRIASVRTTVRTTFQGTFRSISVFYGSCSFSGANCRTQFNQFLPQSSPHQKTVQMTADSKPEKDLRRAFSSHSFAAFAHVVKRESKAMRTREGPNTCTANGCESKTASLSFLSFRRILEANRMF